MAYAPVHDAITSQSDSSTRQLRSGKWLVDRAVFVVITIAILFVAAWLRFDSIGQVPRLTDETDIVVHSLKIVRDGTRPLTDTEAYIGAGFNYVLAATFAVFGVGPVAPRALVAVIGVLTIPAMFFLAGEVSALTRRGTREVPELRTWDRTDVTVGLIGAALLAVSPVHIFVNSRVAWAHCTTPLLTTLALALLVRAVRREQPSLLPWAGLCAGIALQTHPSVVALLPGALAWFLWSGRSLLKHGRWLLLAALLGAVGCADLLVYNLLTGFDSVHSALYVADAYDAERARQNSYLGALLVEGQGLARLLAGAVGLQRGDEVPISPEIVAWAVIAIISVIYAARRGASIALVVSCPFLLVLPLLNSKFEPLLNGRYLMPIVPLIFAACAYTGVETVRNVGRRLGAFRVVATGVGFVMLTIILGLPVWHGDAYQDATVALGVNQTYARLAEEARAAQIGDEVILLDNALGGDRIASPRRGVSVLEYFLVLHPKPPRTLVGEAEDLVKYLNSDEDGALLVLLPRARRLIGARFDVTAIGPAPTLGDQNIRNAGVYRAVPRKK